MRTITEYQPMIFSSLSAHARKRTLRAQKIARLLRYALPLVYALTAVKVTADTGLYPWNPGFWIMVLPVILIGEQLLRAMSASNDAA